MRQRFRANLDDYALCPLDLLDRLKNCRILTEGGLDRLIKCKRARADRGCGTIPRKSFPTCAGKSERLKCNAHAENCQDKELSHEVALEMFDARRERMDSIRAFIVVC